MAVKSTTTSLPASLPASTKKREREGEEDERTAAIGSEQAMASSLPSLPPLLSTPPSLTPLSPHSPSPFSNEISTESIQAPAFTHWTGSTVDFCYYRTCASQTNGTETPNSEVQPQTDMQTGKDTHTTYILYVTSNYDISI